MHTNPDVLTLLALGEHAGDAHDEAHLGHCPVCTAELDELSRVVQTARTVDPDDVPVEPAAEVWRNIVATINDTSAPPRQAAEARPRASAVSVDRSAALPRSATVGRSAPVARGPRRAVAFVLVAAVALVAGLGLGLGISRINEVNQAAAAETHLNALPGWPGAEGTAHLDRNEDGSRTLVVAVTLPRAANGPLEVWLSDERSERMTSMGYLTNGSGSFAVPTDMDVAASPILDVSLEPVADADPEDHSGVSIVRGRMIR